jgi:hypothetical protein
LHTIKTNKENDLPKVAPRQQEVLRRENTFESKENGGRFEFTGNKLFKFHDVISRLYGDSAISALITYCGQESNT